MDIEPHPFTASRPEIVSDYAKLYENVRKHGLRQPLVLYQGKLLDGRKRLRICNELGIEPRLWDYDGSDTGAKLLMAALNRGAAISHRNGKRAEIVAMLKADSTRSDRQIAALLGTGNSFVGRVRRALEQAGEIPPAVVMVGRDGKVYSRNANQAPAPQAEPMISRGYPGAVRKRVERIGELAAKGFNIQQISKTIGSTEEYVRSLIHTHKIPVPREILVARRALDANRVVTQSIDQLSAIAMGLETVEELKLSMEPAQMHELVVEARKALRVINAVVSQLAKGGRQNEAA